MPPAWDTACPGGDLEEGSGDSVLCSVDANMLESSLYATVPRIQKRKRKKKKKTGVLDISHRT